MSRASNCADSPGRLKDKLQLLLRSAGMPSLDPSQAELLVKHLALLLRWNAKINLTAIRDEEGILRRHYLESIVCARFLPAAISTLLDFGSGGGFPGVPCAVCRPELCVTLAESQAKKAAFLSETVRTLGITAHVHRGRVQDLGRERLFDAVTLRAVDQMRRACAAAMARVKPGGWLVVLATESSFESSTRELATIAWQAPVQVPGSDHGFIFMGQKQS